MQTGPAIAAFVIAVLLATSVPVHATTGKAQALHDSAVVRIDAYVDHFRRTFDRSSRRAELAQAEQELQESVRLFRDQRADAWAARALVRLGDARRYREDWNGAITSYREAQVLAGSAQADDVEAKALMGHARAALYGANTAGTAFDLAQRALIPAKRVADRSYLFDAYDLLAQVQVTQGDLVGAADSLNRAFALQELVGDDRLLFYGHLDRADVYQKLAEKCDYDRDFTPCLNAVELARRDYQAALAKAEGLGWSGLVTQTRGFLSRLRVREEMIHGQQRMHRMVTESSVFRPRSADDVLVHERFSAGQNPQLDGLLAWIEHEGGLPVADDARGAYVRGLLSEMNGDGDAALDWYRRATTLLESDRRALHEERSRGSFLADKVEFYYTLMLKLLDRRLYEEAFSTMERSRSRVMSDLLASKELAFSNPTQRTLYSRLQELRAGIAQHQACLFSLRLDQADDSACATVDQYTVKPGTADRGVKVVGADKAQLQWNQTELERSLDALLQDSDALAARIRTESPRLARLVTSEPVSLKAVQTVLAADNSEMVTYVSLESQLVVWHIAPRAVKVYSVFLPRSELQKKVRVLRESLTDPVQRFDAKVARELYLYLLGPVIDRIQSEHLVVLPHDDLYYLPFQALLSNNSDTFVGEQYQISYAPSATVFASLAAPEPLLELSALAVADPALRYAVAEVRTIGDRFSGQVIDDALPTEAVVKAALPGRGLVHLAVHGRFAADEPLLSHLYLSASDGDDGRLTAAEMYGLPLETARLVVLSACETGTVKATRANEVLGMMRGLIFAGADALVLSAWKIDDAATSEWMNAFYAAAQSSTLASAARTAIRALRQKSAYQHPYYWSPFLLIGR